LARAAGVGRGGYEDAHAHGYEDGNEDEDGYRSERIIGNLQ